MPTWVTRGPAAGTGGPAPPAVAYWAAMARWAVVTLLVLVPALARADVYGAAAQPRAPANTDFWRDVVEPHGDEIKDIVMKAQQGLANATTCFQQDCDPTGQLRQKLLDDLYGMLRYARRLDPRQTDVLRLLGQVAEESGRATAAIEAYQAYLAEMDPDQLVPPDVHLRLGRAYLRLGRTGDAIRHFRSGLGTTGGALYGPSASSMAYLGLTLMNTGRMGDALDLLGTSASVANPWAPETLQQLLTVAVAYDRDEQISAAFELLDQIATALTQSYQQYAMNALAQLPTVPAYDIHYFYGLLYESLGYLPEARNEWMLYASAPDAPYRARALAHVAAIDRLQADRLAAAAKAAKAAKKARPAPAVIQPYPYPIP